MDTPIYDKLMSEAIRIGMKKIAPPPIAGTNPRRLHGSAKTRQLLARTNGKGSDVAPED